jgi:TrmH family RNA methyltransferase
MPSEITSIHNPRVKLWSQLLTKRGRESQNKYLLEGIHLIQEALLSQAPLETILFLIDRGLPPELQELNAQSVECIGVSEGVLAKCTETQTPQGVVAIARKLLGSIEPLLDTANGLVIVVDGVQDPGNLGTIIRSADAVGATGVVLGAGTADLYNPKTVRATMGSMFHLPVLECDLLKLLPEVASQGIQIISSGLSAVNHCYEIDLTVATWIIVGNEGSGVSREIERFVSQSVIIPMRGKAESLNVAMAATVLLFESLRQRHFCTNNNSCPL